MPGKPTIAAQPRHRGRDDAEILGDDRQLAELARGRVEDRLARPAHPAPAARILRVRRHRPVRDEAAEVVDPRDVEQGERPAQTLGPPRVARALQRGPVVQRVAPQLALVGERVGRHARDDAVAKERRPCAVVGAAGRDVDRHVADEADPALVRVRAQRAHSRSKRTWSATARRPPANRSQPPIQNDSRARKASISSSLTFAAGSASKPLQAANADEDLYGDRALSGGPAAASATTTGPHAQASPRSGRRRRRACPMAGSSGAAERPRTGAG